MAMSPQLRNKVISAATGGAIAIIVAYLPGQYGVEGTTHYAFKDPGGVWTVCDGHTGNDVIPGKYYSDEECGILLERDLTPVKKAVDSTVKVKIDNYTRAALYSFAFNVGITAYKNSALLRHLNAGDITHACNDLRQWVYVNGQRNKGLINRREIDRQLCFMGQQK
ncbi:lysozyme [Martelella alba]|uniref:Lysozyme n=1 Tax=Martelella alba TaxID=2590451 RepID=A0ABY2SFX8_9HYPH|nr:lysozyme [Martelella alba]TKI03562.1 lysozyme [Martelella alba]